MQPLVAPRQDENGIADFRGTVILRKFEALVAHLQTKKRPEGQRVVDLRAIRGAAEPL